MEAFLQTIMFILIRINETHNTEPKKTKFPLSFFFTFQFFNNLFNLQGCILDFYQIKLVIFFLYFNFFYFLVKNRYIFLIF